MNRIARFFALPLILTSATTSATSFTLTGSLYRSISETVEASASRLSRRHLYTADFAMSKFSGQGIVDAFRLAWRRSGNGLASFEGVVLILRMADGGYTAREMGATNEYKKFSFPWHPATIAVVHTHPNSSDPKPLDDDIMLADKYLVPIFTITSRGMYVYDPATRKTRKVREDLEWLDSRKWVEDYAQSDGASKF